MKYQLIALPALAATVAAQDLNSILGVLQTALPSSLVAEAITNSAAVGSEIASQFAAGETPSWFSALPTDVQGYLVPTDLAGLSSLTEAASSLASSAGLSNATSSTPITTAPVPLGTGTLIGAGNSTVPVSVAPNGTFIGGNSTSAGNSSSNLSSSLSGSTTRSSSSSGSTSGSGSGSGSNSGSSSESSSSVSDAGAAMPTAFMGMGLAGAVGMIGVLAL